MLLRRVLENVRAQNWTAVGLDFVIVVVGVFLAIQASNWSQARQDRALEAQYLDRLYADMRDTLTEYQANAAWDEERLATQAVVMNALDKGQLFESERDAFTRGLIFAGMTNRAARRWGTAAELEATGDMALIRDIGLRDQIARTDASYRRADKINASLETEIIALRARMADRFRSTLPAFAAGDPVEADFDFKALAEDIAFQNMFAMTDLKSRTILRYNADFLRDLAAACGYLADMLDEEPCAYEPPDFDRRFLD